MLLQPVESKLLSHVGYDEDGKTLHVVFTNGHRYSYHDVPKDVFDQLMAAPSVGGHFLKHVRNGGFTFQHHGLD